MPKDAYEQVACDAETGLASRMRFLDHLKHEIDAKELSKRELTILYLKFPEGKKQRMHDVAQCFKRKVNLFDVPSRYDEYSLVTLVARPEDSYFQTLVEQLKRENIHVLLDKHSGETTAEELMANILKSYLQ